MKNVHDRFQQLVEKIIIGLKSMIDITETDGTFGAKLKLDKLILIIMLYV